MKTYPLSMNGSVLLAVSIAVASTISSSVLATEPPRPNIIVVMLDDLGFSDLGCYGAEIETPHIDRLARQGLRFSQFYNTAKCESSRVCLLSGLYTYQAGYRALDRAVTFAELLREAGYFTAMSGKWHLESEPTERGFQHYFGHLSGATNFFTGDDTFRLDGQAWSEFDEDFYTTDAFTDYAIRYVDQAVDRQQPFFVYIAHNAPHYPLQAPEADVMKYRGRYRIGWDQLRQDRYQRQVAMGMIDARWALSPRPDYLPAWDSLNEQQQDWEDFRMAAYAAMVDRVDQNMGRLVQHLADRDLLENTLILLFSDNGACPFERTRGDQYMPWDPRSYWTYDVGWAHAGNTPFRWYKQNQHEGGIASPLVAHWPDGLRTEPGTITHQPAHLIDILPTLVELAGAEYPERFDGRAITPVQGRSLVPIFQGEQRIGHEWLYFQFSDNRALRRGDWKIVSARGGPWELYDLAADRTELNDLADQHPDKVQELAQQWHHVAAEIDQLQPRRRKPVAGRDAPTFPARLMTER
ncbi:MAG: arylsulfatase [Planctomycetaceae bacterium]|nr:MAG: arylsulfatase [Planctomycetaceae bacterium]